MPDKPETEYAIFLASYEMDGEVYGFGFEARDFDDAEERILAIMDTIKLDGVLECTKGLH